MDANATLAALRGLATSYLNGGKWYAEDTDEFVELFDALDRWIISGGFLPAAWSNAGDQEGSK